MTVLQQLCRKALDLAEIERIFIAEANSNEFLPNDPYYKASYHVIPGLESLELWLIKPDGAKLRLISTVTLAI